MNDSKRFAPATERNREPILQVLLRVLPPQGTVLEIASGSGQHAVFFAPRLQPRYWLPSDPDPLNRDSIEAWRRDYGSENLFAPLNLDVREAIWLVEQQKYNQTIKAIVNINMIHISPWSACLGLMSGANRILPPQGILYLYGPFKREGKHTAHSNEAFDSYLQSQNPEWGVRDLEQVVEVAKVQNLILQEIVAMPANNLSVVFKRENSY